MMRTEPYNLSIIQGQFEALISSIPSVYVTPELMKFISESFDIAAYLDGILSEAKEVDADE